MPGAGEGQGHAVAYGVVVVDNEDAGHGSPSPRARGYAGPLSDHSPRTCAPVSSKCWPGRSGRYGGGRAGSGRERVKAVSPGAEVKVISPPCARAIFCAKG